MRTLLSINNYYYPRGGAETVFLEQNRMLEGRGWNVVPFAMHHPSNLPTPWSTHFIEEIELGHAYSLGGRLARAAKVIYSFEARRKLDGLLRAARPDICHAHNIYHHISPSILGLLKRRGIPTVLTLHDLKIACPAYNMLARDGVCERCKGGRLYNVVAQRCIKNSITLSSIVFAEAALHRMLGSYVTCVDYFLVPSKFYIAKLMEWGFAQARFRHVPNFVDAARFSPHFAAGGTFVYFGRLSREKGLSTLIKAAAVAGCRLSIVGTGPLLEELRREAQALGVEADFPGHLRGDRLHDVVRSARAVVLPSEWYENAPMSVLEAYALGKPVIGARIGGIPELIREGETGVGFDSGNAQSLAAALCKMATQADAEVEAMGRQGRQWVEEQFGASRYASRVLDIYRELGVS